MAVDPNPAPLMAVETLQGRLRPLTDEERRARTEAIGRALDEIADMTDETDADAVWRDFMRGIDRGRPHRPLFEGAY